MSAISSPTLTPSIQPIWPRRTRPCFSLVGSHIFALLSLYSWRGLVLFCLPRAERRKELAGFLLTRGLWLVFLDLFFVHTFGWWFNFDYTLLYGDVLWALGWSMVVMSGLVFLPVWAITVVGVAMVALHNLFDRVSAESFGSFHWLWAILHSGDILEPRPGFYFVPGYPLVPWIGVMAAGYGFGTLLLRPSDQRRKWILRLDIGLSLAFIIIRVTNLYGDPHAWTTQKTA